MQSYVWFCSKQSHCVPPVLNLVKVKAKIKKFVELRLNEIEINELFRDIIGLRKDRRLSQDRPIVKLEKILEEQLQHF